MPTQQTLTLPLIWRDRPNGEATLTLGGIIDIGEIMFMPKAGVWCSLGSTITNHRSTGHADREAAMTALETAVKSLEGVAHDETVA